MSIWFSSQAPLLRSTKPVRPGADEAPYRNTETMRSRCLVLYHQSSWCFLHVITASSCLCPWFHIVSYYFLAPETRNLLHLLQDVDMARHSNDWKNEKPAGTHQGAAFSIVIHHVFRCFPPSLWSGGLHEHYSHHELSSFVQSTKIAMAKPSCHILSTFSTILRAECRVVFIAVSVVSRSRLMLFWIMF